ncbi:hypothetical protein Bhyg_03025 [Pseudolycoriella hygida]|uniref:Uncharacterized protein n=1 Tax=Pseudolycoriella hygida TaxID=35572 RepID=A0A9Q0NDB8_9DIPT|nr:hypothetical protein Bhyg_03025 [Pseudolycoriella hygida]
MLNLEQLTEVIKGLKSKKDFDGLNIQFVLDSLKKGVFSNCWKRPMVVVIEKVAVNEVRIGTVVVERVSETKYLGCVIDEKLKFNGNCDYVCKKLSKKAESVYDDRKDCISNDD